MPAVTTRVLQGFDDPSFGPKEWEQLLACGDSDVVFLTWHLQRAWWESFGSGELMLILAERDGRPIALAPFYTEWQMIFFVASRRSDYLDFIGDISDPEVLDALLQAGRDRVLGFQGFRFYCVPGVSHTGKRLKEAGGRLGLECYHSRDIPAPALDMAGQPEVALAAARKKSLVRRENYFRREGSLDIRHFCNGEEVLPHLDEFFEQSRSRWAATDQPSVLEDETSRMYYRRLTRAAAHTGWLRFTRVDWNGGPIAFHFGFSYRGRYLFYLHSFAINLANRSPGELLMRELLLAAIREGAAIFDLGLGDEPYKLRFATHVNEVSTWTLYPSESAAPEQPANGLPQGNR